MTAPSALTVAVSSVLDAIGPTAVAVSGGVDSLTLATLAHRHTKVSVEMYHAVSPAVPAEATDRVRAMATAEGWALEVVDAGEFNDPRYRANPVNRCFYCKTDLYAEIARRTTAQIVSGTNLDDLSDYRPGLDAARAHAVRHPFVEVGVDKQTVRMIARSLGLGRIAELPASPCLSSRVETGIAVDPVTLAMVHETEKLVARALRSRTVRCRVRASGIVIELDATSLSGLLPADQAELSAKIRALLQSVARDCEIKFAPYRLGSAFLREQLSG